jgi:hypothetical protein
MKQFATLAILSVLGCLVKAECTILDGTNFGELVIDANTGVTKSE